jgi:type I restriction enzyme M protein
VRSARTPAIFGKRLLEETRALATASVNHIRYFARNAFWLQERFPDATLRDVEGLVKIVDQKALEANDWSLAPGRYVGVAPQEEDEDFDFEDTMREIHSELADLNAEAAELAATIAKNFEMLAL